MKGNGYERSLFRRRKTPNADNGTSKNKSRLQELIDFSKLSGFERLGIASCAGMLAYAKNWLFLLQEAGFEVYLVHCKAVSMLGN